MVIIHRLHGDDLAGHVLAQEDWDVVRLPAIAEADELHRVETMFGRQCFGRKAGEALQPEREPRRCWHSFAAPWANTILPANTSRRLRLKAAARSRQMAQELCGE